MHKPRPLRSCGPFSALVTTMATIFETFTTNPIKVDYPDLNGGGPLFEMYMWREFPVAAAAPDKDLTSVRALLPTDVLVVAVPSAFAAFVGNQVPRIEIRHHGLGHDGAAGVWASPLPRLALLAHDGFSRHECFLEDVAAW